MNHVPEPQAQKNKKTKAWVHVCTHTLDGEIWPFSFVSCTAAHFEQEVRILLWLLCASLPDAAFLWATSIETWRRTYLKHWPHAASVLLCGWDAWLSQPDRGSWGWAWGWLTTNVTVSFPWHTSPRHLPSTSDTMLLWNESLKRLQATATRRKMREMLSL